MGTWAWFDSGAASTGRLRYLIRYMKACNKVIFFHDESVYTIGADLISDNYTSVNIKSFFWGCKQQLFKHFLQ